MSAHDTGETRRIYDRAFLLSAEKRNQVMDLWEVRQYGIDSFSDADYVHIYGMPPAEWYQRGIRLLARTTVECVRDALGDLIGVDVARVVRGAFPGTPCTVIDPFAGSCNSLYWMLRHLPNARGIAFEMDDAIFEMTTKNIASLDSPIDLRHGDYRDLMPTCAISADQLLVVFVAPPWGDALNLLTGLDLRRTQPPVTEIVDYFERLHAGKPILYVTQVHQHVESTSREELERRFEWSDLCIYDINAEGMKHGILLGSSNWKPAAV